MNTGRFLVLEVLLRVTGLEQHAPPPKHFLSRSHRRFLYDLTADKKTGPDLLENTFILFNVLVHQGLILAGLPVIALYPLYRQSLNEKVLMRWVVNLGFVHPNHFSRRLCWSGSSLAFSDSLLCCAGNADGIR